MDARNKDRITRGYPVNKPDQPVVRISFADAQAFCAWLSDRSGLRCELPSSDVIEHFEHFVDHPTTRLISLMDHTPGQRQFTSLETYKLFYKKLKCWWQANEAYEAALRPFDEKIYDCDDKRRRCVAEMAKLQKQGLRTSPEYAQLEEDKRRLTEEKAKAQEALDVAKGGLQDPGPCPAEWLEPPAGGDLAPNARRVLEYMFPDDDPAMSDEAVRLRAYVLLTILHDHALKGEVSLIADADVWPRDDEDVPDDFALTAWKNMEDNPSWSCGAIDRALRVVQADLDGLRREPVKTPQPRAKNWAEISIEIIDEDTLKYKVEGGVWERVTYAEMGFVDRRKALPNKLWVVFKRLAMYSTGRKIPVKTPTNISKDMDRIRCTLRRFFGLTGTPIRYNKRERTYDTKFNLKDGREGTTR